MKWSHLIGVAVVSIFWIDSAWAWGPATHLHYGMLALSHLSEVAEPMRSLLSSQVLPFLYGCVSADIVLAKKLGRAMTHCHRWDNGIELIEGTENPRIKAFAVGYVSHLAADTISHNCYVPSKTIESYDGGILKHVYWELLFDKKVTTPKTLSLFQEIISGDYEDCDEYLESRIPVRLFDFSTNKKIFNQLLMLQGLHHWQKLWTKLSRENPWTLEDREVKVFTERALGAILSFLNEERNSIYVKVDPTGQERLQGAHTLRRHYRKTLGKNRAVPASIVREAVDRFAREPFEPIDIEELKAA